MLRTTIVNSIATAVILAASYAVGGSLVDAPAPAPVERHAGGLSLMDQHGCWSGDAPADMVGELPGHAVVTWPGDTAPSYDGDRAVGAALGHVFDGTHPRLKVWGFCR